MLKLYNFIKWYPNKAAHPMLVSSTLVLCSAVHGARALESTFHQTKAVEFAHQCHGTFSDLGLLVHDAVSCFSFRWVIIKFRGWSHKSILELRFFSQPPGRCFSAQLPMRITLTLTCLFPLEGRLTARRKVNNLKLTQQL